METRILVIGSTGMLGHQVLKRLEKQRELSVFDLVYRTKRRVQSILCDVTNFNHLEEEIKRIQPKVIVNCVGILVEGSEKSIINAIQVNSLLPHFLSKICDEITAKLIHVSTDCVFSGRIGAYTETSFRDSDSVYGRTKALGEIDSERHLTIRTSIVGPELKEDGVGLLHWFLTVDAETLSGYNRVFWGGVTTIELAKAIEFAVKEEITGTWNLTNGEKISKYEMLKNFNDFLRANKRKNVLPLSTKVSDKSLKSTRKDIDYTVPSYDEMFETMRREIITSMYDYGHYNSLKMD